MTSILENYWFQIVDAYPYRISPLLFMRNGWRPSYFILEESLPSGTEHPDFEMCSNHRGCEICSKWRMLAALMQLVKSSKLMNILVIVRL